MLLKRGTLSTALLLAIASISGCDETPVVTVDAGSDAGRRDVTERDTVDETGADAADATDTTNDSDADPSDTPLDGSPDGNDGGADTVNEDAVPDAACDQDGDGEASEACGGGDCDDDNVRVGPHVRETCDYIDNNCDGRRNEGIECSFFAHTADELYEINPFDRSLVFVTDVPNLFDFDTSTDGTLWGISPNTLWRFDSGSRQWVDEASLADFDDAPNGFAINSRSEAFAIAENDLYEINLEDGSWTRVGSMGNGYVSSGDCVIDKADVLFMTSKHLEDTDVLVRIDSDTAESSAIGELGVTNVYGLTAAWGFMFGVTSRGELVEIDPETGAGEVIHVFEGKRWFGAASTPAR